MFPALCLHWNDNIFQQSIWRIKSKTIEPGIAVECWDTTRTEHGFLEIYY